MAIIALIFVFHRRKEKGCESWEQRPPDTPCPTNEHKDIVNQKWIAN